MANTASLKPFQKGDDPRRNTNGRPKGSKNFSTLVKEALQKKTNNPEDRKILEEHLADVIIHKATVKADFQMIKLIWAYLDGKPPKWRGSSIVPDRKVRVDEGDLERVIKLFESKDQKVKSAYK
jgi:hypothetical protein